MVVNKIFPKLGLAKKSNSKLYEFCQTITGKVPLVFTDTTPKVADVKIAAEDFNTKTLAAVNGTPAQKLARDEARTFVCLLITQLANDCAMQSLGDAVKYLETGYEMRSRGSSRTALDTPGNLVLTSANEGELVVKLNAVPGAVAYAFFIGETAEDPDSYKLADISSDREVTIENLVSTKRYFVRCYAVGRNKLKSEWSQVANKVCS